MSAPKLPLLVRKNIKDEFDGKKDELAKEYKDLLGVDYELKVDFPTLFQDAGEGYGRDSIGSMAYSAIHDAYRRIQSGTDEGKNKDLIEGFNEAVSKHTVTIVADPKFEGYSGCRVTDGVFELVFKPGGLGTNSFYACDNWQTAIDAASVKANPKGLPPLAKSGIKKEFDEKKEDLEKKMSENLGGEKLTIHVDFADVWAKIIEARDAMPEKKKKDLDLDHLAKNLGRFTFQYFESLAYRLEYELKDDELMIEGFLDEVSTKEAWFGMIPESEQLKGSYTDVSIEDGKLWCKTKPTKYAINVSDGFAGFSKLL